MNSKVLFSSLFNGGSSRPPNKPKEPAKRAFQGLAGSALAKVAKQSSNHTLRVARTPDREDPVPFDVWFDQYGQKHGRLDLDCEFQPYAHDKAIRSKVPEGTQHLRQSAAIDPDAAVYQDFGVDLKAPKHEQIGVRFGYLPGASEIKRRRRSDTNWWVFNEQLLREFLRPKYELKNKDEVQKQMYVLHTYYHQSRTDEYILEERSWFSNVKQVKQYRQHLIRSGAEQFKDQKPESTWHGRRKVVRGFRCENPNCDQCKRNEISSDFSGRDNI